ncbi:hypothetical protein [Polaromonas sp.]|uniref:hypothetical protein n=1 Tax=Polaromonas sp. TaxID=1869339 RepID=UPI003BB74420
MDTRTAKVDVSRQIEEIKQLMPETYKSIREKSVEIGNVAFELVRKGLRGEANCFYAFEAGRVVGTPFNMPAITADLALYMVEFGCGFVCMFNVPAPGAV